jgi:hypothetical protein
MTEHAIGELADPDRFDAGAFAGRGAGKAADEDAVGDEDEGQSATPDTEPASAGTA